MKEENKIIYENQKKFIVEFYSKVFNKPMLFSKGIRKLYLDILYSNADPKQLVRYTEKSLWYRFPKVIKNKIEDIRVALKQFNQRIVIDNSNRNNDYLGLACIVKNEAAYIREYIEFYILMGVERIYLFDNESTDGIREKIKDYMDSGTVVYIFYPGQKVQHAAYRFAVRYCRSYTRWLMLLDADEFLFSPEDTNLRLVLKNYEDFPGIGVNWILFGPSGHEKKPSGNVIFNYTETFADNNHVYNCRIKSIVNPKEVESISSPHFCIYKKGRFAVDQNKNEIDGTAAYIKDYGFAFSIKNYREILRINHYITKSLEELRNKCQRGYPDGAMNPNYKTSLKRFDTDLVDDFILMDVMKKANKSVMDSIANNEKH